MHPILPGLRAGHRFRLAFALAIAMTRITALAQDNQQGVPDLFLVVIDVSASMKAALPAPVQPKLTAASRLEEVLRRLDMLANVLPAGVRVIVTEFDSSARQLADITLIAPADREALRKSLQSATSRNGSTHLWRTARDQLRMATRMLTNSPEQRARLLLYTDGEDMEKAPGLDHASILAEFGQQLSAHVQWDWVTLGFDVRPEVKKPLQDAGVRFIAAIEPADLIPLQAEFRLSGTEVKVGQAVRLEDRSASVDVIERIVDWGDGSAPASVPPFTKSYITPGEYTVVLTIRDRRQRTSSSQTTLKVSKPAAPVAILSLDRTRIAWNEAVTATDNTQSTPLARAWRLDGREIDGAAPRISFMPGNPGDHRIELIVRDDFAQESRATADFHISPPPLKQPIIQLTSARPELGQPLWAAAESAGAHVEWLWMLDGQPAGTAAALKLPTDAAGRHSLKLILSDRFGQKSESLVSYEVILPPPPKAAFALPRQRLRPGDSVLLLNESSNATRFNWLIPPQTPSSEVHGLLSVQDYGVLSVSLTAADENGRSDTVTHQIEVPRPEAPVARFRAPESCAPDTTCVLVDESSGEIQHQEWILDGQTRDGGHVLEFQPDRPGEFVVTRIVRGPGGEDSCSKTIRVHAFEPPVAGFVFGSARPNTGDEVLVTDVSSGLVQRIVIEMERFTDAADEIAQVPPMTLLDAEKTNNTPPILRLDCPEAGKFTLRQTVYGPGGMDQAEHQFTVTERYMPVTAELIPQSTSGVAPTTMSFRIVSAGTVSRMVFHAGDGTPERDVTHEGVLQHTYSDGLWQPCLKVYGVDGFAPVTAVANVTIHAPAPAWMRRLWWQIPAGLLSTVTAWYIAALRRRATLERESLLLHGELIVRGLTDPSLTRRATFEGETPSERIELSSELTLRLAAISGETGPEYSISLIAGGVSISERRIEPGEEAEIGELVVTYHP